MSRAAQQKNTTELFGSFFIMDGRLYSEEQMANWRLQIWQDVFVDMNTKNILFKGYGYKEIIPVMTDPTAPGRLGWDGTVDKDGEGEADRNEEGNGDEVGDEDQDWDDD